MINGNCFLGYPIDFKGKCKLYPPYVKDIFNNTEYDFFRYIFTITQEEIDDNIVGNPDNYMELTGNEYFPTPLENLLRLAYNDARIAKKIKQGFEFFLHQKVDFLYEEKKILIGGSIDEIILKINNLDDLIYIDGDEEYFEFQNAIRQILGDEPIDPPVVDLDPRIRRIKAKGRYRDKIAAKVKGGITFDSSLVALCCMGIGITPLNIEGITVAAIKYLTKSYQKKERYELDVQSLLNGADPKKIKPEYWLHELNKKD